MRTLLVAGNYHYILRPYLNTVVNADVLTADKVDSFLSELMDDIDLILYTDDGIGAEYFNFVQLISQTYELVSKKGSIPRIVLMTKNRTVLNLALPPQIEVRFYFGGRIPFCEFKSLESLYQGMVELNDKKAGANEDAWWKKMLSSESPQKTRSMPSNLSQGISRVVAVTGTRGSGVTSTAVNLAESAVKEGLNVVLIDLDFILRGMNMYYSHFTSDTDEARENSLVRLLAKPLNYEECTYKIKPGFYLSTLPYTFKDKQLEEKFLTEERIITMISILKNKFNLCILDLPLEIAKMFKGLLIHVDKFCLCVNNNLYSVLNTVRSLEVNLSEEYKSILIAKSGVIVSRYNDKVVSKGENFTPKRVGEMLRMVSQDFDVLNDPIGFVPICDDFDSQIETEVAIVNNNERMKDSYKKILINVLEGVN